MIRRAIPQCTHTSKTWAASRVTSTMMKVFAHVIVQMKSCFWLRTKTLAADTETLSQVTHDPSNNGFVRK